MRGFPAEHPDLRGSDRFDMPFVTITIRAHVRDA